MKVLLVGPSGNMGLRILAALLTHGHTVVVYVRNAEKLESLLPIAVYDQISITKGDALNSNAIKKAIIDNGCDAVVNSAGVAAMAPWSKGTLLAIFRAVFDAVMEAGKERKKPLRVWFMGGLGVLYFPGTKSMLSDFIPIYLEHRQNVQLLRAVSVEKLEWSMLCPSDMKAESSEISVPTKPLQNGRLVADAPSPPKWQRSWMEHIPLLGKSICTGMNAARYVTTLEQNADFIASDLESRESHWVGTCVGIIDGSK